MSSFIVSARKYRPSKFREVIGQEQVTKTLQNALQKDRVAQAFLFCGPHGVGKTTCARILAKALNCPHVNEEFEPCGKCQSCLNFEKNASFNIIELDAASNNSVEHIRQLTEQVRFAPQQGKHKVFIIDEVHMLSSAAFNAFLKTLEEPPSYAVFILATTEKHKILPTILSRCQIFDFRRIQSVDIVNALKEIMTKEGVQVEDTALHLIAQKANGAMRDALSLYDKIVSSVGNEVTKADVVEHLSLLDQDYYFAVAEAMMQEDVAEVLMAFAKIIRLGFHPEVFLQGFLEHFRNLLLCQDQKTVAILDTSEEIKNKYLQQGSLISTSLVLTALDILNQCYLDISRITNKELHVEIALSKICYASRKIKGEPFGESQKKNSEPGALSATKSSGPTEKSTPKPSIDIPIPERKTPKQTNNIPKATKESGATSLQNSKTAIPSSKTKIASVLDLDALTNIHDEVLEDLKKVKARKEITLEDLQKHWTSYSEEHVQIPSTKATFGSAVLQLDEENLTIRVSNKLQKYAIVDEKPLLKYLREKLQNDGLQMEIIVDRSLEPQEEINHKPSSAKEIYEHFKELNPEIGYMVDKLQLSPDSDFKH